MVKKKKKGKKIPGLSGQAASAKRAAREKEEESESDSDNEAGVREKERQKRLPIGKLQKLREVAASIDPKCAKLTSHDLRVDIRALGVDINQQLSKSNKKVSSRGGIFQELISNVHLSGDTISTWRSGCKKEAEENTEGWEWRGERRRRGLSDRQA